jgi:hypothetical protein
MLFPRTKLVDTFINQLENNNPDFIVLYWWKWSWKTSFLKLLENVGVLNPEKTEYITTSIEDHVTQIDTPEYIVIDAEISQDISEIRAFIKSKLPDSKVIYFSQKHIQILTDNEMLYEIPYISFREFAEWHHHSVNISEILEWRANIEKYLRTQRTLYPSRSVWEESHTLNETRMNYLSRNSKKWKNHCSQKSMMNSWSSYVHLLWVLVNSSKKKNSQNSSVYLEEKYENIQKFSQNIRLYSQLDDTIRIQVWNSLDT